MLTPSQHEHQVRVLEKVLERLRADAPPMCCMNCDNWRGEACEKFGAVPPEHRQTPGCPEYAEEIPF